jgi:hypothetical protein
MEYGHSIWFALANLYVGGLCTLQALEVSQWMLQVCESAAVGMNFELAIPDDTQSEAWI